MNGKAIAIRVGDGTYCHTCAGKHVAPWYGGSVQAAFDDEADIGEVNAYDCDDLIADGGQLRCDDCDVVIFDFEVSA